MALIDAVIVNYRTPELLEACVRSLERHLPRQLVKVWTIDNSPPEEAIGEYKIENKGYGQACNYGASLGEAPFLLFLNADTEATAQSNTHIIFDLFSRDRSIAIVGPKQVNPAGWIASAGCPPAENPVGYTIRGWREQDHGQYTETALDCVYVAGSIVFSRRSDFESLGGFLETPLYYEETFLCMKARHYGRRVIYCGKSLWIHHWDASPKQDQHLLSGRPIAQQSHSIFVEACQREGILPIPFA